VGQFSEKGGTLVIAVDLHRVGQIAQPGRGIFFQSNSVSQKLVYILHGSTF
jgi:hypothetical protein